jgi:hypothetical protein
VLQFLAFVDIIGVGGFKIYLPFKAPAMVNRF